MKTEIVKSVNGYNVERVVGTRGHFWVTMRSGAWGREEYTFSSIKAAVKFIEIYTA